MKKNSIKIAVFTIVACMLMVSPAEAMMAYFSTRMPKEAKVGLTLLGYAGIAIVAKSLWDFFTLSVDDSKKIDEDYEKIETVNETSANNIDNNNYEFTDEEYDVFFDTKEASMNIYNFDQLSYDEETSSYLMSPLGLELSSAWLSIPAHQEKLEDDLDKEIGWCCKSKSFYGLVNNTLVAFLIRNDHNFVDSTLYIASSSRNYANQLAHSLTKPGVYTYTEDASFNAEVEKNKMVNDFALYAFTVSAC